MDKEEKEILETVKKFREQIKSELDKVTEANSPNIYRMLQTHKGYRRIEERIIETCINNGIVPAAAIPQIESMLEI